MDDNDKKIIFPISILVIGALFGGFIFQGLFSLFRVNYFMPISLKVIVPSLIISRLIFSFGFWDIGFSKLNVRLLNYINSRIWFLSRFICYPSVKYFRVISNYRLKIVDIG